MDTGTNISIDAHYSGKETLRRISGAEIGASAYDFVACMVDDDGAIGRERAGAALFIQGFVGLLGIRLRFDKVCTTCADILIACTLREYCMVCRSQ